MALRELMLAKELSEKKHALEALRESAKEFETREAELEQAIEEATTEEEKATVETAVDEFEKDKADNEEKAAALESEIASLEKELEERAAKAKETAEKVNEPTPVEEETRKEEKYNMVIRKLENMSIEERKAFFEKEEVRSFLQKVREIRTTGVTNVSITIPVEIVGMINQVAEETSKMVKHIRVENVPGISRMIVDGGFPEAVWTEQCAILNETGIGLYDMELDGYKVGAFIKVCNAILEDSDVNLAQTIITKLGQGIGYALDKAILFGTGTKMPVGIVTRLLETSEPQNYRSTALPWEDLHTSNVLKITVANSTGIKLFQEILKDAGVANSKYATGGRFWVMNEKTKTALQAEAMSISASGAIVSGLGNAMPVVGGAIEVLDFIPDDVIICGYEGLYLLAQRHGATFDSNDRLWWKEEQTGFKGVARYDGAPAIPDAFVAIGINNKTVSAEGITFESDTANAAASA